MPLIQLCFQQADHSLRFDQANPDTVRAILERRLLSDERASLKSLM